MMDSGMHHRDSREYLMNDVYLTSNHSNSSVSFRKRCKTFACCCLGIVTFTGINALFFTMGYVYNDKLHCNITNIPSIIQDDYN